MSRNNTSEKLLEQIDDAVKKVSDEAYATALKQIRTTARRWTRSWRSCARRRPCRATSSAPSWRVHGDPRGEPRGGPGHRDHQLDSPPRPPPASLRPLRGASA